MAEIKTETEWVLDKHPVTIAEWIDVMGADALPEQLRGKDSHVPVTWVTAYQADEYAHRIDGRLPTDAELKAAFADQSITRLRPVMWEWTSTIGGSNRVVRGGGWGYDYAVNLSASYRYRSNPEPRYSSVGFRCARPAVVQSEPHTIPNEEPHWPAKDVSPAVRPPVDPYALHRAKLRAEGIETTSGCYGERLHHVPGVGISASKKSKLTIYVDNDWCWADWQGDG